MLKEGEYFLLVAEEIPQIEVSPEDSSRDNCWSIIEEKLQPQKADILGVFFWSFCLLWRHATFPKLVQPFLGKH